MMTSLQELVLIQIYMGSSRADSTQQLEQGAKGSLEECIAGLPCSRVCQLPPLRWFAAQCRNACKAGVAWPPLEMQGSMLCISCIREQSVPAYGSSV